METLNNTLLLALLDAAQNDVPASVALLARELGRSRRDIADALDDLGRAHLVSVQTIRLTFLGLARAAKLRSRRSGRVALAA